MGDVRANLRTHNLTALVVYGITVKEAMGDTMAMLNRDSIQHGPDVGCFDCEQSLHWCKHHVCPGQPLGRLEYVVE